MRIEQRKRLKKQGLTSVPYIMGDYEDIEELIHEYLWEIGKLKGRRAFSLTEIQEITQFQSKHRVRGHVENLIKRGKIKREFSSERQRTEYKLMEVDEYG